MGNKREEKVDHDVNVEDGGDLGVVVGFGVGDRRNVLDQAKARLARCPSGALDEAINLKEMEMSTK